MNRYKIEYLADSEIGIWDEFLSNSQNASLFNSVMWSDILLEMFGLERRVISVTDNGSIIAGLIIHYKKKQGLKVITRSPFTLYSGIISSLPLNEKKQKLTEHTIEFSDMIIKNIMREFKFVDINSTLSADDMRSFIWNGWLVTPQYTYILELGDKERIWNNFSSSLRRKIRHCEEENFLVIPETDPERLLDFQIESYSRSGLKPLMSKTDFIKLIDLARKKNICRLYSVSSKDKIHSMRAALTWKNKVYDWIAGTATEHLTSNATHFLVFDILKKFSDEGYSTFDFLGANTKTIADFKRSFGGDLCPYYNTVYYSSPAIKALIGINNFINRLSRH